MTEEIRYKQDDERVMDRSTRRLIDKIGIVVSLILMTIAVVGEGLGWWGAFGIVLTLASLAIGLFSVLDDNGSAILREVHKGVEAVRDDHSRVLDNQTKMLGTQEKMLGNQEAMLGNQTTMVENQQEMVDEQSSIGKTLGRIEQILDARLPGGNQD